ncbi:PA2169 family four-helix-bundle protein [Novosphingobium rosa]|uniref:PA2169 family four-helix-bundle protein n=1 Tax=Novosphingobium rosa TaxID=76978 RepID=UPI00082F23C4|nr:PA2169 family four-helix-bundle protein [Novosphingobium rosa]
MSQHDHDISTLNDLIATTIDSADGYAEAAKEARGSRFETLFNARAGERRNIANTLQREVGLLGGEAESSGTILASAERLFFNLKSVVTSHDEKMIVNEVESGEDHIKAKYEDAVRDRGLSTQVKALIEQAYQTVRAGHDEMRDIKHSMQG